MSGLKMWLPFSSSQQLGEELVVNGDFDTDSDWNKTGTWSIESNYATANGNGTSQYLQQDFTITNGKVYLFTYEIIENTLNGVGSALSGSGGFVQVFLSNVVGTHQVYITADNSGAAYALKIAVSATASTGTIKLDNVSVKEVGQFSLDETTNNNNATLFTGNCLDFDGTNDYLDIDGFTMSGTNATFAFWINPDATSGFILDSTETTTSNVNRFVLGFLSNKISIFSTNAWDSFETINTGVWSRVVITISGTTAKCFVNGVQLGSNVTIVAIDLSSSTLVKIGSRYSGTQDYINGSLSDFQIWDVAWSATDIANDYAEPNQLVSSVSVSNLKAWWAMTEGSGSVAVDNATAIGSELVTNGDFATDSDWTKETGWTISGGTANFSGGSGNKSIYQAIGITDGKTYEIEYTVSSISAGAVSVRFGGMAGVSEVTATTTGVFSGFITANSSANGNVQIEDNDNNFVGSIDNVSVKEVSAGTINGATYTPAQSSILQLGMINWSNGSGVFLPPSPSNATQDILGNAVRDRFNSLNLTGTGYGEVADSASINPSAITVQCWIFSNTENSKGLVAKWGNGLLDYMLFKTTNNFRFYISSSGLVSGTIPNTGWVNIAGTYDGSTRRTFINGLQSTTDSFTTTIPNNTNVLEVGRYGSNSTYSYSERIDDVKLYDRALTADEILQNYKAGLSAHTN